MNAAALVPIVLKASIFLSVFAIGLGATPRDATYLFRNPVKLFTAVLAVYVLMPLFAVAIAMNVDLTPPVAIALIALSLCPIPPILPNKLVQAGGTESYAVGLLVGLAVLSIVFVPVALEILERVFGMPLQMTMAAVATLVGSTILLPIGSGIAVRGFAPAIAEKLAKITKRVGMIGLLLGLIAILAATGRTVLGLVGNGTVLVFVAFVLVGLLVGHLLGGPERDGRVSLAISTASRHPGIAAAIVHANFPEQKLAMAAVLLYLLVSVLAALPYMKWAKGRGQG